MDVLPNEEEQMLKNGAREFLEAESPPSLAREMERDDLGYPPALWKQMGDLGWLGLAIPEEYGGQGATLTYLGIVLEEVGRAISPVPFHSTMVPALTVASDGTEEQRRELLPRVCSGDLVMSWAFTERDARYRPESVRMEAVEEGDYFLLSGTKTFVDSFGASEKCLVACRTAPPSHSGEGITLFLVDTDSPGVSHVPLVTLAKDRQSKVTFDRVRVPRSSIVGELDQGWPVAERMLDRGTALLCAQMVGAARKDVEMAVEYAKQRVAFGRPIGAFQSIQHMCADMVLWVDGGQLLTYEALWRMDQGLPAAVEVSQAKAFCNDRCEAAVRSSQVIHGGIGFMMEFDLHLWFRRVSAWTMRMGTSFEHRARVARALLDAPGRVRLGS
ncbi:MAG: acyl-CoA/acyl-ACP dehydrogenase [Dehalococcoidia bacterium]|nr:acyl-CoA/acyl-ACP dehydrogenase [Dehalococcoidia bacterium]